MKFMPEARYLRELLFVVFKSFEKMIMLYDKDKHYTEQYHILKLTS